VRRFLLLFGWLTFCTLNASADLLSNMQICANANTNCTFLPLSTVPTITTADLLNVPSLNENLFLFGNGQTFSPSGTWTLSVMLSWGNSSVSEMVGFTGSNRLLSFSIGIPDTLAFPYTPTPFTLNLPMTDSDGHLIASATDHFNLVTPVPEPTAFLLLGSGMVGVGWHAARKIFRRATGS
jgi:hypothetical protein